MSDGDKKLQDFYNEAFALACTQEPSLVAGVFMAQALRLYKSFLSEDEYNGMVDTISDNRAKIKPFEEMKKHRLH
jgi:hypothetical protein